MNKIIKATRKIAPFLVLMLPLVIFLKSPAGFPYPSEESKYSDITITHFPNAVYLKTQLRENSVFPLWSPSILSGYPFVANPLSGFWYPPGWLALVFPLPLGFNLTAMLHLLFGGVGMYLLLRGERLSKKAALFGAVAFEGLPKLFAHYGAGHLTLFYAFTWTPWLLWSGKKSLCRENGVDFLPTLFFSLIALADPRWILYSVVLWFSYMLMNNHMIWRNNFRDNQKLWVNKIRLYMGRLGSTILRFTAQLTFGVMISTPLLLPLMEYTNLSTRNQMSEGDLLSFSLPPGRLLGFVFPDFGGFHEYMVYSGSIILLLVAIAILRRGKDLRDYFWIFAALCFLILALGKYSPLSSIIVSVPGLNLLRVPSRSIFLTSFCMIVSASIIVYVLEINISFKLPKPSKLLYVAFSSLAVFLGFGVSFLQPQRPTQFIYGAIVLLVGFVWVEMRFLFNRNHNRVNIPNQNESKTMMLSISQGYWYIGLITILILDLGIVNKSLITFKDSKEVLSEGSQVASYLASDEGYFRVYSPSYSLPQSTAIIHDIELADGVDPLQLSAYVDYMEDATGIENEGYSVTLPPYEQGNPSEDNRSSIPNAKLLGILNVKYVVSDFDLDVDGLVYMARFDRSRIYENRDFLPRAWVEVDEKLIVDRSIAQKSAEIKRHSPNTIEVRASGPGILVLSEIAYPGWVAYVDGEETPISVTHRILRDVPLDHGDHQVALTFRPTYVYLGLVLAVLAIILILMMSLIHKKV